MGHVKPIIGKSVSGELDGKATMLTPVTIYVDYESAVSVAMSKKPESDSAFQNAFRKEVLACVGQTAYHFANKETAEEVQAKLASLQAQAGEGHAEINEEADSELKDSFNLRKNKKPK